MIDHRRHPGNADASGACHPTEPSHGPGDTRYPGAGNLRRGDTSRRRKQRSPQPVPGCGERRAQPCPGSRVTKPGAANDRRAWIPGSGGTIGSSYPPTRGTHMSGTTDDLKGRAKEAVGDLTDDDRLRREGKTDRAAGKAKDKVDDAKDWIEDKVDDVRDSVSTRPLTPGFPPWPTPRREPPRATGRSRARARGGRGARRCRAMHTRTSRFPGPRRPSADARRLLRALCGSAGTPGDAVNRAELALSEVLTNALRRTGTAPIMLHLDVDAGQVTVSGDRLRRRPDAARVPRPRTTCTAGAWPSSLRWRPRWGWERPAAAAAGWCGSPSALRTTSSLPALVPCA